jgi:hypothetical protein
MKLKKLLFSSLAVGAILVSIGVGARATAWPVAESESFRAISLMESFPGDDTRELALTAFLSAPLIDPKTKAVIRQVVLVQNFESIGDHRVLARACLFRQVSPTSSDAISAKYTVSDTSGTENTLFTVDVAPRLGKVWMSVTTEDDLSVTVTKMP